MDCLILVHTALPNPVIWPGMGDLCGPCSVQCISWVYSRGTRRVFGVGPLKLFLRMIGLKDLMYSAREVGYGYQVVEHGTVLVQLPSGKFCIFP